MKEDKESDDARLGAHRRLHAVLPEGFIPPKSAAVSALEETMHSAVMQLTEAIGYVDRIAAAEPVGYADFPANPRRNHNDARKYTLKDAKQEARQAAKHLRTAWDLLDPTISSRTTSR